MLKVLLDVRGVLGVFWKWRSWVWTSLCLHVRSLAALFLVLPTSSPKDDQGRRHQG